MTAQQFRDVVASRIPTPDEFVAFARGQGWKVIERDGGGVLVANRNDPLAVKLAKLLSREPYRTNVLNKVRAAWEAQPKAEVSPPALVVAPAPETPSPPRRMREWYWRDGHLSREEEFWRIADDQHCVGAWWWRFVGEEKWRRTPACEKWYGVTISPPEPPLADGEHPRRTADGGTVVALPAPSGPAVGGGDTTAHADRGEARPLGAGGEGPYGERA